MSNETQIEKVVIINDVNEILTVSSLQIAEHFGKRHDHVLRDIQKIISSITSTQNGGDIKAENSVVTSMFFESTYPDSYGRQQKYYECTRDGFSLLAMGFTGKAALEWKLKYIAAFNKMEKRIKSAASIDMNAEFKRQRLEIMEMNAQARIMKEENKRLDALFKSGKVEGLSVSAVLALIKEKPQEHEKTYSATEVAKMLGVTSQKIGRVSNANGLKTDEYGITVLDKAKNCDKQVPSFRYNDKGVEKLRELLDTE